MKAIKLSLRLWMTGAATFSFLAGWIFFAHSNKPAPLVSSTDTGASPAAQPQTVQPRTTNPFSTRRRFGGIQNSQPQFSQSNPFFQPRFRTGGS